MLIPGTVIEVNGWDAFAGNCSKWAIGRRATVIDTPGWTFANGCFPAHLAGNTYNNPITEGGFHLLENVTYIVIQAGPLSKAPTYKLEVPRKRDRDSIAQLHIIQKDWTKIKMPSDCFSRGDIVQHVSGKLEGICEEKRFRMWGLKIYGEPRTIFFDVKFLRKLKAETPFGG